MAACLMAELGTNIPPCDGDEGAREMKSITEYDDPAELRRLMENAKRLENAKIYWEAFNRLCLVSGKDDPDPLMRDFYSNFDSL